MHTSRKVAWMVWIIGSIFYAYQYILRVMPNVMLEDMMQQFQIGAGAFGQLSGVYYIGYSLMHLPIGIMLDRFGPKKVMTGCILMTVAGLIPLVFAEYWIYPLIGRICIGMGSSAAILGVFKIIRMTFSEERFPRMLSLSVMIGLIGAIYAGGPMSHMRTLMGYHLVVECFAVLGLLLAALTYWIVPNVKEEQQTSVVSDIKEVLSNQRVVLSCIFAGLMVGPIEGFADVWGTAFLKQVYGYDSTMAASLPSMIFIGMCFGSPVLSFIAEKLGSYGGTIIGAGIGMTLCFLASLGWILSPKILSINLILLGICCSYQILAIYKISTYVREQVAGLTTAIANMIIMIFGYAFHASIGGVINYMGGPALSDALLYGVAIIPLGVSIGTLGFILITLSEKKRKQLLS